MNGLVGPTRILSKTEHSLYRLKVLLFSIAICFGFSHLWLGRTGVHGIDPISYMDMGDALMRGNWNAAANGIWSPLYPLLLGAALRFVKPSASWEFPLVHVIGFIIYVGMIFSFDFLWSELGRALRERSTSERRRWVVFSDRSWLVIGYCLFLWVSLLMIRVTDESPDMLAAVAVYVASALLVRITDGRARIGTFVVLGAVLGLGYLAKTILFPLSFVFLLVAAVGTYKKQEPLARPLAAFVVFLITASPLLFVLSRAKGRFTFGDSGTINYLWHVEGVPRTYWQGDYPGSGAPIHPPRLILAKPAVYEFAAPFPVTFSPWYDPSYWYEGMHLHFDLKKQIRALTEAVGIYHGLFFKPGAVLIAISLILLFLGDSLRSALGRWDLLLPALAGLGAYALVHVEPRYVGSFILVFWGAVLSQVRLPESELAVRSLRFSTLAIAVIYSVELCAGTYAAAVDEKQVTAEMQESQQIAREIRKAGLQPGDRTAIIGGISGMIWARLAKVQIVANLPDDKDFWSQGPGAQSKALRAFASTGAKVVVAEAVPAVLATGGWMRIGNTDFYLRALSAAAIADPTEQ
jgi:hypothetical protein